jgi:hypothetical protein
MRRALIGLATAVVVMAVAPSGAAAQSRAPDITTGPSMAGAAVVGELLEAVGATWTGRSVTVTWLWLRCDSESLMSCRAIPGAAGQSYTVGTADVGKRLRALVMVSNRDGTDYAWTSATSVIAAPAPPPPAVTPQPLPSPPPVVAPPVPAPPAVVTPEAVAPPRMMRPAPVVRVKGWLTLRGARINLLSVRAPRAATISVRCSGGGCPRTAPAGAADLTRLRAYEGMFRAGARLVISVTRPGFIGKHTLIRIRRGKPPVRVDRCLYPGTKRPTACPR